jgi:hypothetical protein
VCLRVVPSLALVLMLRPMLTLMPMRAAMWTPTIYVDAALMLGTVSFEGLRASVRHACASEQHGATELATGDDADRHMLFPY